MTAPVVNRIVVVGASAAGVAVADTLRDEGFDGRITLVGDEPHQPYDRPPLSKDVLAGRRDAASIALRPATHYADRDIDLRTGTEAVRVRARERRVVLSVGDELPYDALVVATGVAPRPWRSGLQPTGVHVLRTLADLTAFRADVLQARRLLVVGAGFLGTEVAATCRSLGLDVTVVCGHRELLAKQLGRMAGSRLAALHAEHGVRILPGVGLAHLLTSGGRVSGAVLTDQTVAEADVVLVAIGSRPRTEWLTGSGLPVRDGVECDARGRAAPGVFAAGDVARWHDCGTGVSERVEHRVHATEQGMHVARTVLGADEPFLSHPYGWTDQFDTRVQTYGFLSGRHRMAVIEGSLEERRFVAVYARHGQVTGALAWNCPKGLHRARAMVRARMPWDDAARLDPGHAAATSSRARQRHIHQDSRGVLR